MLPIEFDACVMIVSLKAGESVQGKELRELAVKQAASE